ncbi:MAG TPA: 50S ribosomal protein L17 [Clostridiales bacterium]|nr:50S ribosomal protein L17 [Clostridiales bacterium]
MAAVKKLGRPTDERMAVIRNQATTLLWTGKLETTLEKAKATRSYAEKLITLAMNTYEDTVTVTKEVVNAKGEKVKKEVVVDGPKKLNARRKLMASLYDIQEQRLPKESKEDFAKRTGNVAHPLIEKMFNVYAPKYAKRKAELGQGGGYTRVLQLGARRGDNAQMAIVELV